MARKSEPENTLDELTRRACDAYGIAPEYLMSSRTYPDTGDVVLLTRGGKLVDWRETKTVTPLSTIEVTGINQELEARRLALRKV